MISVGSRDARKGMRLGLGFDSGGPVGDMEETELEEGEAFSLHNNDDSDESIDPDVALSYIDEKLQDVLGHFQKDFEGGVSAENLGAKFGGYGSFLPTYQRSPVCSHPRTPTKFQNQNSPRSPNNSQLEGGLRLSAISSATSQSVKLGPTSTSATSVPALPPLSLNDPSKQEVWVPSSHSTEDLAPKKESANKKSSKISDQKTLKVRLKVGSDNLSTRKNAEIYSGLGLDVSPSSSLDESPSGSEGMSREDAPNESPTSILQIMTSFPVHGNLLLSPLPDDLLHLTENVKFAKDGRSMPVPKGAENSRVSVNGFDSVKGDRKVIGEKKMKSVGKSGFSAELNKSVEDACYNVGLTSKKEIDFDSLSCEELVSNTLKLPMLTNEVGWFDKPKGELAEKVGEDKKVSSFNNVSVYPGKDGHRKEEKSSDSVKAESDVSKMKKAIYATLIDPPKQKVTQKWTNNDQDGVKLPAEKESSFLEGKRKSKGTNVRGNLAVEDPKESSRPGSSIPKSKKNSHANGSTAKNEPEDLKIQKDIMKARDAYKDFFGDPHLDEQDNQIDAFKTPEGKVRDSGVNEKNTSAINDALKERLSSRKFDKPSKLEAYPKAVSNIPPHSTSGPTPDGLLPLAGTQFIQENWVGCDKCQRWRLLPLGTNPEDLPDKWTCSMLNWLPKMNRCSVTEEETTKALLALYQVPTAENQNYVHNAGATPAGVWNQSNQNYGLHAVPGGGKKKHGLQEIINASNKDGPNLTRKSLPSSYKSTKLNDMNQSPLMNKSDSQQLSKSSDLPVEKQHYKHKENHKGAEQYSDGGDTRNLKMGSRRGTDHDCIRASKKVKTESMHSDEDWKFDHGGANGKVGTSSTNGFDATAAKDQLKYSDRGSSKERYDTKDLSLVAAEKTEGADGSLDLANCDNRIIAPKKRKVKEGQDPEIHLDPSIEYDPEDRRGVQEVFSENDYRKEKKAKFSKSDGKEYDGSHGNGRTGSKGNIGSTLSQRSLDGTDYGTRDLGSAQAATSSSSKISGSHKTKTSFQEVKGSPVESVSSSPMRLLDPDKLTSVRRNLKEKYESQGTEFFSVGSPRKCSDGEEDGGSDRSATARKDKTFSITNRSMDSMLDFHDKNCSNLSGGKVKTKGVRSSDIANQHFTCGDVNDLCQYTQNPSKTQTSDRHEEEKQKGNHYSGNEPRSRKSGKGSLRSKDKNRKEKHEDVSKSKSKSKSKLSGSVTDSQDAKLREKKSKFQEKPELKFDETEKRYIGKKVSSGELSGDNSKRSSVSSYGGRDGPDMKADVNFTQDPLSIPKQNLQNRDGERSLKRLLSEKNDQKDLASRKGRLLPLPQSGGGQNETLSRCPRPVSGTHKGNEADKLVIDASEVDDALKVQRQIRKADNQNGGQQVSIRHPTPCGNRLRDNDAPSPLRRESSTHAASSALKEAKDLKHRADRIKNTESDMERTNLYLEAVLKFLRASSLLESSNSENGKYGEMIQAMQIYSSTAKLCDFCAREYEKQKNLAFAALAYKCTEVAYMRVIYSSHSNASRDRHELQMALQIVPPGESPSSSASDVDNLNLATADKVTVPKSVGSPQVAGNHTIAAKNRPNYLRLLNFTQDVHLAMEASRKSRNAFAAACTSLSDAKYKEGMTSIKRALDFNFQDLEGLLRLVKLAIEAFNP